MCLLSHESWDCFRKPFLGTCHDRTFLTQSSPLYNYAVVWEARWLSLFIFYRQYDQIWELDEKDPLVGPEGGESVKDVASRLAKTMAIIESEFEGYPFLPLNIIWNSSSICVFFSTSLCNISIRALQLVQADKRFTVTCKYFSKFQILNILFCLVI